MRRNLRCGQLDLFMNFLYFLELISSFTGRQEYTPTQDGKESDDNITIIPPNNKLKKVETTINPIQNPSHELPDQNGLVFEKENNTSTPMTKSTAHRENATKNKKPKKTKFPFKCSICTADFKRKEQMETHVSTVHEGKKLYKCTDCKKEFTLKRNLYRHSITTKHSYPFSLKIKGTGEAKFDCEICGKKFMKKESIQHHIKAIHEGKKPFKCSICGIAFGYEKTLSRHIQNIHD